MNSDDDTKNRQSSLAKTVKQVSHIDVLAADVESLTPPAPIKRTRQRQSKGEPRYPKKPPPPPPYEEVADWRGIERVIIPQTPERPYSGLPGAMPSQSFPVRQNQAPAIARSPEELVASYRGDMVVS